MRKISADIIYPVTSPPIKNGVVVTSDIGEILEVRERKEEEDVEFHQGMIVPGFVNAHCHLELSHMKGLVPTGTQLIPFIKEVVSKRGFPEEEIQREIQRADKEMFDNGIVAVGDISNVTDTLEVKIASKIEYYTFVENFDFFQSQNAQTSFDQYKAVYDQYVQHQEHVSMVPHAPYSVSKELFSLVNSVNMQKRTVSIHNQETPPENQLFLTGDGEFKEFFESAGFDMSHLKAEGRTAIHYALDHLDKKQRILFVHNTLTTEVDITTAHDKMNEVFWATCPNANLYIENRLPNYQNFLNANATVCIGTDSLTSNWQLNIWEEIRTIMRYQSYVDFETVLKWATLNGASALGLQGKIGSIEVGKTPGLILVSGENPLVGEYRISRL